MLDKRGGYLQGYNLQIACARGQLLLAIELQDNPADMTALAPMVQRSQHNRAAAGLTDEVQAWLAESGYASAANFEALAGLPLLVSVTNEGQHIGDSPPEENNIPVGQREMAARLATPAGQALYRRRGALVEPASRNCSSDLAATSTTGPPQPWTPRSNSWAQCTTWPSYCATAPPTAD